jgi:hypothetical protein
MVKVLVIVTYPAMSTLSRMVAPTASPANSPICMHGNSC